MNGLTRDERARDPALYDPQKGLETVVVAEAAEKAAARAVRADPDDPLARQRLRDIVERKLIEQRDYVVWRDGEMEPRRPGRKLPGVNRAPAVNLPPFDPGQDVADRWRKALVKKDFDAALADAQHRSLRICEQQNAKDSQLIQQSLSAEHYTPAEYIAAATAVLGAIDLDPASCAEANRTVGASRYFDAATDGLRQEWSGRVWLNPPYGDLPGPFIAKLCGHLGAGEVEAAIVLVNAHCTDTAWFRPLWDGLLCFTDHRINFSGDEDRSGSTHGSVFVYFGSARKKFLGHFDPFGPIMERAR